MAGARRTARSAFVGAVTRHYGLHRQRPGAGRPREAAAATQGERPKGSGEAAAASGGGPRRHEPLAADAAPESLPGVSRLAPGARRRPSLAGAPGGRALESRTESCHSIWAKRPRKKGHASLGARICSADGCSRWRQLCRLAWRQRAAIGRFQESSLDAKEPSGMPMFLRDQLRPLPPCHEAPSAAI
jgi:hypothetical protein